MHVQDNLGKSPDRPSSAPASTNYTDAISYENALTPSVSSSEASGSSLGFSETEKDRDVS